MKLQEIILLLFALLFAIAAVVTGQIETSKSDNASNTSATSEKVLEPFHANVQTVPTEELVVTNPAEATSQVNAFFQSFLKSQKQEMVEESAPLAKSILSKKLQQDISEEPETMAGDIARTVGLLNAPQQINIVRTEQITPDSINVVVSVKLDQDQTIEKSISVIQEDNAWKIDSFEIIDSEL